VVAAAKQSAVAWAEAAEATLEASKAATCKIVRRGPLFSLPPLPPLPQVELAGAKDIAESGLRSIGSTPNASITNGSKHVASARAQALDLLELGEYESAAAILAACQHLDPALEDLRKEMVALMMEKPGSMTTAHDDMSPVATPLDSPHQPTNVIDATSKRDLNDVFACEDIQSPIASALNASDTDGILRGLKVADFKKQAVAAGIELFSIEDALDSANPRRALATLLSDGSMSIDGGARVTPSATKLPTQLSPTVQKSYDIRTDAQKLSHTDQSPQQCETDVRNPDARQLGSSTPMCQPDISRDQVCVCSTRSAPSKKVQNGISCAGSDAELSPDWHAHLSSVLDRWRRWLRKQPAAIQSVSSFEEQYFPRLIRDVWRTAASPRSIDRVIEEYMLGGLLNHGGRTAIAPRVRDECGTIACAQGGRVDQAVPSRWQTAFATIERKIYAAEVESNWRQTVVAKVFRSPPNIAWRVQHRRLYTRKLQSGLRYGPGPPGAVKRP
jgi:hypothetical protein